MQGGAEISLQELSGRRVLVLGLGRSGQSAAAFCAARGADVVAADERALDALGPIELPPGVERVVGEPFPPSRDFDLVVPSPGVPPARYEKGAARVWGDVELAARALSIPIVAVTGTNGKSTTTCLVEAMLRAAGFRARAAGNLGTPALELVGEPLDVAVLEVSSFQLETIESFAPHVAVLLNVTPDHLDRHGSFGAYAAAKARIFENQGPEDVAVLNADDAASRTIAPGLEARVFEFGAHGPFERGAWLDTGSAVLRSEPAGTLTRLPLDGVALLGAHNRENLLAALCAAVAAGAEPEKAFAAAEDFEGLPHRSQSVGRVDGVLYVDDSKATNPSAALRSAEGFGTNLVWIGGGRAKGLDLAPLAEGLRSQLRAAILLGEAAGALEQALGPRVDCHRAASMEAAVRHAHELAQPGDVVLLSPGCSSLDQFRNFEERGDRFQDAVRGLAQPGDSA
jgi:UDP-N-acetylmuramoylalanine--D-glutamate ligase